MFVQNFINQLQQFTYYCVIREKLCIHA